MSKFKAVKGVYIPKVDELENSFSIENRETKYLISANVDAEIIASTFFELAEKMSMPGFLILEVGTNLKVEKEFRVENTSKFHKDVFYLDGMDWSKFETIFNDYKELLVNDGMVNFGFGSHSGKEEIFVAPYKVFTIWTQRPEEFKKVFLSRDFKEVENLKTAWHLFSQKEPGQKSAIQVNGKGVYDMVDDLKLKGLYFAERRED